MSLRSRQAERHYKRGQPGSKKPEVEQEMDERQIHVYIYPFTAHIHSLRSLNIKHPYTHVNTNEESSKLDKNMATDRDVQCNRKEIIVMHKLYSVCVD